MTDALRLPRHAWPDHPRYPDQVLLLGSHRAFRQTSAVLVRRAEAGGDAAGIGFMFRYWKAGMSGHERYEEGKLYPYLEARWGLSCDALRGGHHQLARLEEAVHEALAQCDGEATPALAQALRRHDDALCAHLDAEEELVIPALLALAPEEFETYYHSSIHTLLADLASRK